VAGSGDDSSAEEFNGGSILVCLAAGVGSEAQPARNIRATIDMAALINSLDDGGANLKLIGA
jgi:hypothetical protein